MFLAGKATFMALHKSQNFAPYVCYLHRKIFEKKESLFLMIWIMPAV